MICRFELANATITDGAMTIGAGGTVTLNNSTLTGSVDTLTIDNSGVIDVVTSSSAINFSDLTNEGGSASVQIEDVRLSLDDTTVSGGATTETGPDAQINVDAGNSATFENTTLTLSNNTAANGAVLVAGTLTIGSTVTILGTGTFTLAEGGILEFGGAVPNAATVAFAGTTGTLALADPAEFAAAISGLVVGDTIDLPNIAPADITSVTINSSDSTIVVDETNGSVLTFNYTGNLNGDQFAPPATDNNGGTDLVLEQAPSLPMVDNWTGNGNDGNWFDGNNWSAGLPASNSEVEIDVNGSITISLGDAVAYSLDNAEQLQLQNGASLTTINGLDNSGDVMWTRLWRQRRQRLSIGGTLTNSNFVQIGNGGMASTVTAQGLSNTGTIDIHGGSTSQALLNIAAAAPVDLDRRGQYQRRRAVGICRHRARSARLPAGRRSTLTARMP